MRFFQRLDVVIPAPAGIQWHRKWLMQPCVYMLASRKRGTLYIGVTSNLPRRIWEHKNGAFEGFSKEHGRIAACLV